MRSAGTILRGCVLGLGIMTGCGGSDGPSGPGPQTPGPPTENATVTAGAVATTFTPASVSITRNGSVVWVFGSLIHNVTFSSAGAPANIPDASNTQVSRTFGTAGTFNYSCTLHPGMNGTVFVQ